MKDQFLDQTNLENTDDSGVEYEEFSGDEIREPFDPTKIKVSTQPMTIDLLMKRIDQDALDLSPAFQRDSGLWNLQAQSRLIESILIRIPIPAFYVDATDEDKWLVVDGLQRLTALKRFVIDKTLVLHGLEFLQLNGSKFDDLSVRYQRRILETQVIVYQIEQGTPDNVKFNVFKRINTGGLPLSPQEIRHALNQGPITAFLSKLADSDEFKTATAGGVSDKRMTARELALRFLAFFLTPYTEYVSDFDAFLNDAMKNLNQQEKHYPELEAKFLTSMIRAKAIFGKYAFRKLYTRDAPRTAINKALFETWSVNLSRISESEFETIHNRCDLLINLFIDLMNNREFNEAISQGTGDKNKVYIRFSKVSKIIQEVLR